MDLFHEIRALGRRGLSVSAIAAELKIDWKTAAKYVKSERPPSYKPRGVPTRGDPMAEFAELAREKLALAPKLSAGELYALLRPRGYGGSERTIQRRMRSWREERPKERFFEQLYEPGEQAQFDFKEKVELPFADGERVAYLHFGTLPHSNAFFIHCYPQKTFECFMDGAHSFFEKIGGMTKNARIDNLSPCVRRVRKGGERDYTEAFERAMAHYGFGVLPCSPGKGNEKGDVERDIQTFARRLGNHVRVHGLVFRDFGHLNEEVASFCERERSEDVRQALAAEQKSLLPLLARDEAVLCRIEEPRASPHGTVAVGKATYSVPDEWIGLKCRAVAGPFTTRIARLGSPAEAVVHPRLAEGEESILLEHVIKSLLRKPQAMVRWRHRGILFPDPVFMALYKALQAKNKLFPAAAEREFLRILNLIHHAPLSEIKCAAEIALEAGCDDIFAEVRDLLCAERRPAATVAWLLPAFAQTPLSPNLKDYDQLIPQQGAIG